MVHKLPVKSGRPPWLRVPYPRIPLPRAPSSVVFLFLLGVFSPWGVVRLRGMSPWYVFLPRVLTPWCVFVPRMFAIFTPWTVQRRRVALVIEFGKKFWGGARECICTRFSKTRVVHN